MSDQSSASQQPKKKSIGISKKSSDIFSKIGKIEKDLETTNRNLERPVQSLLIGQGFDTHVFSEGRKLILGGVEVPFAKGLKAHSDGDVVLHAIIDSLLGAMGWGDIGKWFPDTDKLYKDIDSKVLLKKVIYELTQTHFVSNIDVTVLAQQPKLNQHFAAMKTTISKLTECTAINLKATTTEKMNDEGRGLCISAMSVCLLMKK